MCLTTNDTLLLNGQCPFLLRVHKIRELHTVGDILDAMERGIIIIPNLQIRKSRLRECTIYHSFISQETKASGHRRLDLGCPAVMGTDNSEIQACGLLTQGPFHSPQMNCAFSPGRGRSEGEGGAGPA